MGSESALLISLIRNLSKESGTEQQRDRVKTELTESFENVDEKLEMIVEGHYEKLKGTIHAFTSIAGRVTESQGRVKALKRSLLDCKTLLKCRRDELKKLWMEGVECKEILKLMDRIDEAKQAPAKLKQFMAAKRYLDATNLLVHMVAVLRGKLSEVDALRDLRMEMESQKAKLYDVLLEELHRQIYVKSSTQAKKRMKASQENLTSSSPLPVRKLSALAAQKGLTHRRMGSGPSALDTSDLQLGENGHRDGEESTHSMLMIIECFAVLKKMPDAVQEIAVKMRVDMNGIVDRLSEQVADSSQRAGVLAAHQPRLLLELLQLCFDKFRAVAAAHSLAVSSFRRISQKYGQGNVKLYGEADVWAAIQYSIQLMLSDYLDVQNASHSIHRLSSFTDTTDLSSFFAPKRKGVTARPHKRVLFRFESSSYALSVRSYMREQREQRQQETGSEEDLPSLARVASTPLYVCKPDTTNITVVFTALMSFTQEVETAVSSHSSQHCALRNFIEDYVQLNFLGYVRDDLNDQLEAAIKGPDAQKTLADAATMKGTGLQRPLLQTAVVLAQGLDHLRSLMEHLPPYASDFLEMARDILLTYKDSSSLLFKAILGATEDGQLRTISGMWARDEDIRRLLMSLPSWTSLKQQQEQQQQHKQTRKEMQEDLQEIRQRHKQECDMLTRNLGDRLLSKAAIILDLDELRVIANLQESLDWLSGRLQAVLLAIAPTDGGRSRHHQFDVSPDLLRSVQQLHGDLVALSETCLLTLHLEIRCHCFYFLLPAARQSSYVCDADSMEPDDNVVFLNRDLSTTEDVMSQALSPVKFKYLFEGIGYLIASVLISSTAYLEKINANGIKRMCRNIFVLQQNLTNITMSREVDLDRARQYFELLFLNGEELLTIVVEQGPQFEEVEYSHALRLIARSQQRFNEQKLQERLLKLSEILNDLL